MSEEQYIKLTSYFRKTKFRESMVKYLCRFTPLIVFITYTFTVLSLFINKSDKIFLFILVPASNFLFVSIIRKVLNKPRPYDLFNHKPLVKYTKGKRKSFPSRHTSSAFIIAISYFYLNNPLLGVSMLITAIIICLSRIIAGVHFPKDVAAAILISLIWAFIGYY